MISPNHRERLTKFVELMCSADNDYFSAEECIRILDWYFICYEHFTGKPHPPLSARQAVAVMKKMPYAGKESTMPLEAEDYTYLIPEYFMVDFPNCDYNISHFFSGDIRKNRYMEKIRRPE